MALKPNEPSVVLASIEKAIDKLSSEKAERRAVVVISDSDPSTTGVSESKIVDLARDREVALYFVSFGRNKQEPSSVLKKLGRDTAGGAHDVADLPRQELLEFASELSTHLENGLVLSFDARGLPQASEIKLSANLEGVGRVSADPIAVERQTEDTWLDSSRSFVADNLFMLLAALGLGVGGVLVLRLRGAKNRSARFDVEEDTPDEVADIDDDEYTAEATSFGNTVSAADAEEPRAWLEILGDHRERVPLHSGNFQVGRGKDSDIRLENSSVHRQHAMIQMDADGRFSIHDLGTKNGVFVNGNRYSQRTLANGDLIELGEVKLRFAEVPA
ncbi:MAG: FHA domain-containing protein [Alphaproteobacteria bacterium]|nr:FHA domain-containing protein [Alphaproteobacteria bacterium]